jgi:hypothetical protein
MRSPGYGKAPGLPPDQAEGTDRGWAKVLSSLETLLETGRPLGALA